MYPPRQEFRVLDLPREQHGMTQHPAGSGDSENSNDFTCKQASKEKEKERERERQDGGEYEE